MASSPSARPASPPGSPPNISEGWRFKLYQLDADGQWNDKGTGFMVIKDDERLGGAAFHAVDEQNGHVLLNSRILLEDIYQQQGENIITWKEPAGHGKEGPELALSFQEEQGRREIWNKICEVQGKFNSSDYRAFERLDSSTGDGTEDGKTLPPPTLGNLQEILDTMLAVTPAYRDRYIRSLLEKEAEYVHKLMRVFTDCEEMEDTASLKLLARLLKCIMLLNDINLTEALVQPETFVNFVGILEHDPDLKSRGRYRQFITEQARFHQVIPFEDPKMIEKITQNFYLLLLKEHLLRPTMDETNLTSISSLIFFNSTFILDRIFRESDYLQRIYKLLKSVESREQRETIWRFLRELVNLSKHTQPTNQSAFLRYLAEECPFFDTCVPVLSDPEASLRERMCCVEVLQNFLNQEAALFRSYVVESSKIPPKPQANDQAPIEEPGNANLLYWMIWRLANDRDIGVILHLAECLQLTLDIETMEGPDKDKFLTAFYDHYMVWLIQPLSQLPCGDSKRPSSPAPEPEEDAVLGNICGHICEIVTYGVRFHGYRMRYFMIHQNLGHKVLRLTQARQKFLRLAAVRFVRAIAGSKDAQSQRRIAQVNMLEPLLDLYVENGMTSSNLIHSAIIELFDFLRTENIKQVLEYLYKKFHDRLEELGKSAPVFNAVLERHERNVDFDNNVHGPLADGNVAEKSRKRAAEEDDAYFAEDDDEEEASGALGPVPMDVVVPSLDRDLNPPSEAQPPSPPPPPIRLVDYDDDDDDEVDPFWSGKGRSSSSTKGGHANRVNGTASGGGSITFAPVGAHGKKSSRHGDAGCGGGNAENGDVTDHGGREDGVAASTASPAAAAEDQTTAVPGAGGAKRLKV